MSVTRVNIIENDLMSAAFLTSLNQTAVPHLKKEKNRWFDKLVDSSDRQ